MVPPAVPPDLRPAAPQGEKQPEPVHDEPEQTDMDIQADQQPVISDVPPYQRSPY